jgi:hypothetical protein
MQRGDGPLILFHRIPMSRISSVYLLCHSDDFKKDVVSLAMNLS